MEKRVLPDVLSFGLSLTYAFRADSSTLLANRKGRQTRRTKAAFMVKSELCKSQLSLLTKLFKALI